MQKLLFQFFLINYRPIGNGGTDFFFSKNRENSFLEFRQEHPIANEVAIENKASAALTEWLLAQLK